MRIAVLLKNWNYFSVVFILAKYGAGLDPLAAGSGPRAMDTPVLKDRGGTGANLS